MDGMPTWSLTFIAAELLFLILRQREIIVALKTDAQRTRAEKYQISHGLERSLVSEAILFVPASATLLLLAAPGLLARFITFAGPRAGYVLMGVASYGFPFALFRRTVIQISLIFLRSFAGVLAKQVRDAEEGEPS